MTWSGSDAVNRTANMTNMNSHFEPLSTFTLNSKPTLTDVKHKLSSNLTLLNISKRVIGFLDAGPLCLGVERLKTKLSFFVHLCVLPAEAPLLHWCLRLL